MIDPEGNSILPSSTGKITRQRDLRKDWVKVQEQDKKWGEGLLLLVNPAVKKKKEAVLVL